MIVQPAALQVFRVLRLKHFVYFFWVRLHQVKYILDGTSGPFYGKHVRRTKIMNETRPILQCLTHEQTR